MTTLLGRESVKEKNIAFQVRLSIFVQCKSAKKGFLQTNVGIHFKHFGMRVSSPAGKYEALINMS